MDTQVLKCGPKPHLSSIKVKYNQETESNAFRMSIKSSSDSMRHCVDRCIRFVTLRTLSPACLSSMNHTWSGCIRKPIPVFSLWYNVLVRILRSAFKRTIGHNFDQWVTSESGLGTIQTCACRDWGVKDSPSKMALKTLVSLGSEEQRTFCSSRRKQTSGPGLLLDLSDLITWDTFVGVIGISKVSSKSGCKGGRTTEDNRFFVWVLLKLGGALYNFSS